MSSNVKSFEVGSLVHPAIMFMNSNKSESNIRQTIQRNRQKCSVAGIALMNEAIINKGPNRYNGAAKDKTGFSRGKQVNRSKEEWVRIENTHEPIITYPQYIRAVFSLKQQKAKESKNLKKHLLLQVLRQGIVQCALRHCVLQAAVIQDRF